MTKKKQPMNLIPQETIESKIYLIRGKKVMLDRDLAALYGVETRVLNQAVRRNQERFPEDFMFSLTRKEVRNLRSQIVILGHGKYSKYLPQAFTQDGVAMLSSILNSGRAIQVNIQIIRAFNRLREIVQAHKELVLKLRELEGKVDKHDQEIKTIFDAIRKLMTPPPDPPKPRIGFRP